jgi:site-specific recombinase XerD
MKYRAVFGDRRLSEIGYLDLETYRNRRKATPTRAGKPRTDATINRELSTLRHMLNKAVEWGMLEHNPLNKGSRLMLKENNHRLRFLTDSEIEALLRASDDLKTHTPTCGPLCKRPCLPACGGTSFFP